MYRNAFMIRRKAIAIKSVCQISIAIFHITTQLIKRLQKFGWGSEIIYILLRWLVFRRQNMSSCAWKKFSQVIAAQGSNAFSVGISCDFRTIFRDYCPNDKIEMLCVQMSHCIGILNYIQMPSCNHVWNLPWFALLNLSNIHCSYKF